MLLLSSYAAAATRLAGSGRGDRNGDGVLACLLSGASAVGDGRDSDCRRPAGKTRKSGTLHIVSFPPLVSATKVWKHTNRSDRSAVIAW